VQRIDYKYILSHLSNVGDLYWRYRLTSVLVLGISCSFCAPKRLVHNILLFSSWPLAGPKHEHLVIQTL
jgi:hypothetical protein